MINKSYQIELRHYVYFLTVAEELHFRKAAEKLFITQPGLSKQIRQMEEGLGVSLFKRDKKRVTLTSAGHYLKKEVEVVLGHLQLMKRQVALIGEGQMGEVRIGFLGSAMQQVIPNLLLRLQKQYPAIHASLDELSNKAQIESVLKDKLDIGFVRLGQVPPSLELKPVFEDTFSLVVPNEMALNQKTFLGMNQVREEPFILFSREYSPQYYETVLSICQDAGFLPKVSHKSVHAHTIFRLVENGLGIAIVPTALQRGFDMKVNFIELKKISQRAVLSAIWKKDNRNPVLNHCLRLLFD
jgi:DNA-binding transcriptional LysR family regulator